MSSPAFLDELEHRLRCQGGLPQRYVRRVIAELSDHYHTIEENNSRAGLDETESARDAESRVAADPDALFDAIVCRRGRGLAGAAARLVRFARLHPFVTFVVAPLPTMLAIGYTLKFVGVLLYSLLVDSLNVDNMQPLLVGSVDTAFKSCAYGVTPLLALLFCHLADRGGRPIIYALGSCALLSLAGGMLKLDLVQCLASKHVAYFQRFGLDAVRLSLPMIVFVLHTTRRLLSPRHRASLLLAR